MKKAYTLIELIMTIVIGGVVFLSISGAYRQIITSMANNVDYSKAVSLTQLEDSIVNNLNYTDATLTPVYNNTTTNYNSSGYDLQRIVTYEAGDGASAQSLKHITIIIKRGTKTIMSTDTFRAKNVYYAP